MSYRSVNELFWTLPVLSLPTCGYCKCVNEIMNINGVICGVCLYVWDLLQWYEVGSDFSRMCLMSFASCLCMYSCKNLVVLLLCWATALPWRVAEEGGRCSIVNIDLQFVNSGTHFSKCQACFSTMLSALFSHWAPDEDKVTALQRNAGRRETRKGFFLSLSFFTAGWDVFRAWGHCEVFGNRKQAGCKVKDSSV